MHTDERRAELYMLITLGLEGLFPIIANAVADRFPVFLYMALCTSIAASLFGFLLWKSGEFFTPVPPGAWKNLLGIGILIQGNLSLIFFAARYTSAINTALLMQVEILTTFIVSFLLLREAAHRHHIEGAAAVLLGTVFVVFNGTTALNPGDMLILIAICIFPFGNILAKKALRQLPTKRVLFFRYLFGCTLCLMLSATFERTQFSAIVWDSRAILLVLAYSTLILGLSKTLWYTSLRTLSLNKAIAMASATPAFSLLFAFGLLGEVPSVYQWTGFVLTIAGIGLLMRTSKVPAAAPDLV